ncbi:hypothetical protein [Parendozoicomonas haliclonae]|uniref:Uncharacterized protein n=1 Tax=Parendozoicomonas haliclonae TaxID=1960125 RepID=A0A1X7AJA8_9GAMM|nr:hypothetical protein [Parendozoicomonas haliclonae]SMA45563.1 hypothetical protein EHSB41UT_01950 [Parendozoicomonas haliclonae]
MAEQCKCGNEVELGAEIQLHCQKCQQKFEKFDIKKPAKVALITAALAYGGSIFIDYAITDNRYPIKTEYALMKACLDGDVRPVRYTHYSKKNEICACALEDTMNEISYTRSLVDEKGLARAFGKNAKACMN